MTREATPAPGGYQMATNKKAETPGYVKAKDVADLLDITIQRVGQLRKEGVLKQYKTPAGDRYQLVETVRSYIKYLRSQTTSKASPTAKRTAEAEADLKEAKAAIFKYQREELEGKLHQSEDVEAMLTDLVFEIRGMITALPGRLAVDTAQIDTPEEEAIRIRDEVNVILNTLATYKYDPARFQRRAQDRKEAELIDEDE